MSPSFWTGVSYLWYLVAGLSLPNCLLISLSFQASSLTRRPTRRRPQSKSKLAYSLEFFICLAEKGVGALGA